MTTLDVVHRNIVFAVSVPLTDSQWVAVHGWALDFYEGVTDGSATHDKNQIAQTELIRAINRREFNVAAAEFLRWCFRKQTLDVPALNRRKIEKHLFLKAVLDVDPRRSGKV